MKLIEAYLVSSYTLPTHFESIGAKEQAIIKVNDHINAKTEQFKFSVETEKSQV